MVLHNAEPHYLLPACIGAAAFANLSVVMGPTPRSVAPKSCGTPNGYPDHGVRGCVNQHLIGG